MTRPTRKPVPSASVANVHEGRLRDLWRIIRWELRMLPKNPTYVGAIVSLTLLGGLYVTLIYRPLQNALACFILMALVCFLAILVLFFLVWIGVWGFLLLNPHATVYMNDDAALGMRSSVDRGGKTTWKVVQHIARAPGGLGAGLRKTIAPSITAAADNARVPITAKAVNKKIEARYIDSLADFQVQSDGRRRVSRQPQ